MADESTNLPAEPDETFVRLFLAHQRKLHAYVLMLVPNVADADDVLQEASLILWRKFAEYRPGTNFSAWAFRIAHNVALNLRAKNARSRVVFDQALCERIGSAAEGMMPELDDRRVVLVDCVGKLSPRDRDLLEKRYQPGATINSVAKEVGRPLQGLYKAMQRIHDALFDCVGRTLKIRGATS